MVNPALVETTPLFVLVLVRRHRTKTIMMTMQTTSRVISEIVNAAECNSRHTNDSGPDSLVSATISS